MAIASPVQFEVTLIVTGGANGFAIAQVQRGHRTRATRLLDADTPWPLSLAAERDNVAADVDKCVADTLRAQNCRGPVERHALEIATEIECHRWITTADEAFAQRFRE